MRVRIAATVVAIALAAGCSSGHGSASGPSWATHASVFSAHVRIALLHPGSRRSAGPPQRILLDTATGRFRITAGAVRSDAHFVYVSDGHTATQEWGSPAHRIITEYDGSRSFLADQTGHIPLELIRNFVAGSAPPSGVHVRVVSQGPPAILVATTTTERLRITIGRAAHVAAGAFRTARGKRAQLVRELHPGVKPSGRVAAYWLGPAWHGHSARSSSEASGRGGWYAVDYPHLAVEVMARQGGLSGNTPARIGDGTHATLNVAAVSPDGTVSISGTTDDGNGVIGTDVVVIGTGANPGKTMAFVFLPHAMVTLSGTAVTPGSAAAIARTLRPL